LDLILHGSPRVPSLGQGFVPGQQECRSFGKEWKGFKQKVYKASHIWSFFISGCIDRGDVLLVWCPTRDMSGDFMTKALQSTLFHKFRHQIMRVIPAQHPGPGIAKMMIEKSYQKSLDFRIRLW
jgi:hypothetical protein